MSNPSFMDATGFILRQQFHREGNKIVDRTSDRSIIIPGSDNLIEQTMQYFKSIIHLYEKKSKGKFFDKISDYFVLPRDKVRLVVRKKINSLVEADSNPDPLIEYMTVVGAVLSLVRESTSNNIVEQMITENPEIAPLKEKLLDKMVMEESLLANLAFLYHIAEINDQNLPEKYLLEERLAAIERLPQNDL